MELSSISVNLKKSRLWDQICPKNISDKNFEKINIKIIISNSNGTSLHFSQFEKIQIMGPKKTKKH